MHHTQNVTTEDLSYLTAIIRIIRPRGITTASTKNVKKTPKPQLLRNVTCVYFGV